VQLTGLERIFIGGWNQKKELSFFETLTLALWRKGGDAGV
jgi:hypothetical protein